MGTVQSIRFILSAAAAAWIVIFSLVGVMAPAWTLKIFNEQATINAIHTVRLASVLWILIAVLWMFVYVRKLQKQMED